MTKLEQYLIKMFSSVTQSPSPVCLDFIIGIYLDDLDVIELLFDIEADLEIYSSNDDAYTSAATLRDFKDLIIADCPDAEQRAEEYYERFN